MRTIQILNKFDEVNVILKYLYICEDKSIIVKNSMNIDIEIKIDYNGNIYRADITGHKIPFDLSYSELFTVVDQLKELPAIELPNQFSNRFEEIKAITNRNLALNKR